MKLRLSVWDILNFFLIFFLIVPDGISSISSTIYNVAYIYLQAVVYAIILMIFLISIGQKLEKPLMLSWILAFVGYGFIITLLNKKDLFSFYQAFAPCLFAALFIYSNRNHFPKIISIFLFWLEFWIYLNLICMFIYPEGLYLSNANGAVACWILGYKSSLQYYVLPAICLEWINYSYQKNKIHFLFLITICCIESYLTGNTMLIVGLIVLIIFMMLGNIKNNTIIFNIRNYSIAVIAVNIITVFFTTWLKSTGWGTAVLNWLGKDSTLSSRGSIIWPKTISEIADNLWFGQGVWSSSDRVSLYSSFSAAIHSHNQLLEILFIGGIILMIIYIGLHFKIFKILMNNKNLEVSKILSVCIFVLYLMAVVEIFLRKCGGATWFILFLAAYCSEIDDQFRLSKRIRKKISIRRQVFRHINK